MMANREGLFHAWPTAIGLGQTRENKLLQVVIQYRLAEELVEGDWVDCSPENLEITGYHFLERRDHSLNENTIESLKAALGWDGRDPFWLQDNADGLGDKLVQVKLDWEEYNGRQNLRVQFLNPYGARPMGVPSGGDELRKAVANRLGAQFRALAGGTPANAPKPATPRPSAPARPPAGDSAPAATKAALKTATMEQAWEEFCRHCPAPQWDQESTEAEWFRVIDEMFPGRQVNELIGADWARMLAEGPGRIMPF
jgi:hypothetical protein